LTRARESGDVRATGIIKSNMAYGFLEAGDDERAAVLWAEALEGLRAVGDTYGVGSVLANKATVALLRSDVEGAAADLRESLRMSSSIGDTQTVAHTLPVVAVTLWSRGEPHAAVTLAAAGDALCTTHRFELDSLERELVDEAMQAARQALGDTFDQAWQAGAQLDVDAAVELAVTKLRS